MAKKTTPNTQNKTLVVQTLVVKPNNRSVLDVGQWRTALRAADFGRRQRLYELYEDVLLDNVLKGAIRKRIYAITNAQLVFMRNGKPEPAIDSLMDTQEFEELLTEIINARFWGKSVIELDFVDGITPYSIPRQHLNVKKGVIVMNPNDEHGIPYKGDDFFLEAGQDDDLGAILEAAPYAIYKRGGFGDWAQFAELFGMPFRLGKYAGHDQESRRLLEDALDQSGSASYVVVPKETDVEIKESAAANGGGDLFSKLRDACNEEILIGILGQTMTTTDGSSLSQSKVHKDVEEDLNRADRRFVARVLNQSLLPRLAKRGFPVEGGYFYFPDEGESLSITQQMEIHVRAKNELGLTLDEDWLHEFYSIPKGKKDPEKKDPEPDEKKKGKKDEKEDEENLSDRSFLLELWDRATGFFVGAPAQPGVCQMCGGIHLMEGSNNNLPPFDEKALFTRVASGNLAWDQQLFDYTAGVLTGAIEDAFRPNKLAYETTYGYEPDALHVAYDMNIFKFSAAKTLAQIQELNNAFKQAKSFHEFEQAALQISGKFNRARLQAEYQTAMAVASSSETYWRLKSQAHIFKHWQYVTVNDGLVREEHAKLHNLILPEDDPRWLKIYPPNGWRCRCRVKGVLPHESGGVKVKTEQAKVDQYLKSAEWRRVKANGFAVNRALSGEVFNENQMYIKKFPKMASKYLKNINYKTLKAGTWEQNRLKADAPVHKYEGGASEWADSNRLNGKITIADYKGRSIILEDKVFKNHTLSKKENRVPYLEAMKRALKEPSEVWLTSNEGKDDFRNIVFIKFFKDEAVVVLGQIDKGGYRVASWFPFWEKLDRSGNITKHRSGMLIYKK